MSTRQEFETLFDQCPLIAILRGITPDEAESIGDALVEGGIRIIEVPLNSPQPLDSIARLSARFAGKAMIGAGTVLQPQQIAAIRAAGGRLIVSPSTNRDVIATAVAADMVSCPGYFTPTEAFEALDAGANALKLFPAEGASPAVLKAQRAVLPKDARVIVVGGVAPDSIAPWLAAGANGFGLGSGLYRPGQSAAETLDRAHAYQAALRALRT